MGVVERVLGVMVPAFQTPHVSVYCGDVLDVLRELADGSVDCCVTSPRLEPTPAEYVQKMAEVFREVRRVLADRGTLWLNLGDSYGTGTTAVRKRGSRGLGANTQEAQDAMPRVGGMAKQLMGIPWRVAFALQDDGWYLRSDIIWAKPNPMPESVTDRPTKSHEYVFLLSKSERYFYDADAIAEPLAATSLDRLSQNVEAQEGSDRVPGKTNGRMKAVVRWRGEKYEDMAVHATRNARTVWTIATQPYPEAHFATFPRELPERCIKAGCPADGTVLDPFAGSGTTLAVARDLNRKSIGIELNPEYVRLIERRCAQIALL